MDVPVRLHNGAGIVKMAPKIHAGSFRFPVPAQQTTGRR
jgi:hypothetical protein